MESDSKPSFFKHVFSLDGDSKSEMLNICQYAILAIIPVIGINKALKRFTPELDERKSSLEVILEILIQVIIIFMALLVIHRVIIYVPTYSRMEYPEFNVIQIVLITLMFLFSLNTSIAEKANLIIMRLTDYWEGRSGSSKKKKRTGGGGASSAGMMGGDTTPLMPSGQQATRPVQSTPNYDNIYANDTTPLVGAATPGGGGGGAESFSPMMPGGLGPTLAQGGGGFGEPMAANSVLGGSFGGAW
jgi:hypothetical protein